MTFLDDQYRIKLGTKAVSKVNQDQTWIIQKYQEGNVRMIRENDLMNYTIPINQLIKEFDVEK